RFTPQRSNSELLLPRAMIHIVHQQHFERGHGLEARCRHAAHDPAAERVAGNDETELELRELAASFRYEVRRGDEQARGSSARAEILLLCPCRALHHSDMMFVNYR